MPNIVFYRCNTCGKIMALLKNEGASRTCCKQNMTELEPNSTDGAIEKHVPVVTRGDSRLEVTVGATLHPMLPEHFIELIALDTGNKTEILYLEPNLEPKAVFENVDSGTVYAYCNIHGLWKADF